METKKGVIKTLLKLKESEKNGELIGFVYVDKYNHVWGVHEEDPRKKKICILSKEIDKNSIEPGILYNVQLGDMPLNKGYIIQKIEPVKFKAKIETQIIGHTCQVIVTFGNKKLYYNPVSGKSVHSRTSEGFLNLLQSRNDIENKEEVLTTVKKCIQKVDKYISEALPKYEAMVETQIIPKCFYQTIVKYGNVTLYYNPFDGASKERVLENLIEKIKDAVDITNKEEALEAIKRSAKMIQYHMEADGYILPKQNVV